MSPSTHKGGVIMPSVSFRTASTKTNIKHNNRERNPTNSDPARTPDNINFVQRDIAEVYAELFQPSLDKYNHSMKRSDRKIDDYYKKSLHDKKTKEQHEIIVQVGTIDDSKQYWEKYKDILTEYMTDFQDRNEHLKVYNAVLHLDEATPHLHINFVPYADYDKGLKRRVNFEKAMKQQGFNTFLDWRTTEVSTLEHLMNVRNLKRDLVGTHEKYLSPQEYKNITHEIVKQANEQKQAIIQEIQSQKFILVEANNIDTLAPKKSITGVYKLTEPEMSHYKATLKENQVLKSENSALSKDLIQKKTENGWLITLLDKLKLKALKIMEQKIIDLKAEVQNLMKSIYQKDQQLESQENKFANETDQLKDKFSWAEEIIETNPVLNQKYQDGKVNYIKRMAFERRQQSKGKNNLRDYSQGR